MSIAMTQPRGSRLAILASAWRIAVAGAAAIGSLVTTKLMRRKRSPMKHPLVVGLTVFGGTVLAAIAMMKRAAHRRARREDEAMLREELARFEDEGGNPAPQ